jgi:hypothetical protein
MKKDILEHPEIVIDELIVKYDDGYIKCKR